MSDEKETGWYGNVTDSQVVIDGQGRIMDGGGHGELTVTPQVRRAVENGILVEIEPVEDQDASEEEAPPYLGEYENVATNAKGEVVNAEGDVIEDVPGAPLPKTSEDEKPKAKKKSR